VGKEPKYIFARTAELELKQLECEYEEGNIEYPSCQIHDLPVVCKKALDENDVRGAIHGCTFTYKICHQRWFKLMKGGL